MMASPNLHQTHVGEDLRRWQIVCVIVGLFLIAGMAVGCGSGSSSSESGGESPSEGEAVMQPLAACDLLAKTDAETILGGAVDEPQQNSQEDKERQSWMSTCNYYSPQAERGAGLLVQPSANADPAQALDAHVASLKKSLGEAYQAETIAGVGGAAIWDGSVKQLTVFDDAHMLIVTVTGGGQAEGVALETAKALAEKALSKLPQ
jgi:hypothetical protein